MGANTTVLPLLKGVWAKLKANTKRSAGGKIMSLNKTSGITKMSGTSKTIETQTGAPASRHSVPGDLKEVQSHNVTESSKTEEETTIPVVQEELKVGKRKVERPVRVFKHVVEKPVEATVRLRDEIVTVERRVVDRRPGDADLKAFTDSKIEMMETTEEPTVSKEVHVTEEIIVTKHAKEHEEKIRDKVRKTEINIEGLGADKLREAA
jgi:stress response protein YsnF